MKLGVTLDILNQKGTPAFNADTLANRPAAGFTGRMFISTDTFAFYRDTGTSWDLIGGPGSGTITGSGAAGQVTYFDGTSSITGSNNLFWDATNNRLGVNTNTPTASFDVHGTTNVIAQLNQLTSGQNALLTFQDNSVGKWRLGNIYNAAANDFGIVDITNTLQRLTIKNTGQTFIGAEVTSSGLFVVNSATSDNHIVVTGANAPSIRLNNGSSVKQGGIAISTATNNFIQGSADRDFCVFNSSTTASPILFGVWNGTNTQEVARVSSSLNFLIGSSTDTGQKFQVTGTTKFNNSVSIINNTSLNLQDSVGNAGFSIKNTSSNVAFLQQLNNGELSFQAGFSSSASNIITFKVGAGTEVARITNAGFVGIGTTNPLDNFVVSNAGANSLSFDVTFSSGASLIYSYNRSTSVYTNFILQGLNTIFKQGTTEYMRIKSTGIVNVVNTPIYASNALALAGGLVAGDIYKSATGALSIVY
jgi:hypothetical protein